MYRLCPQNESLIWDTETNEMFHPEADSPASVKFQEWLKEGGTFVVELTKEEKLARVKNELEYKLSLVDSAVSQKRSEATFEVNGRNFYLDLVTIPGIYMALPLLPSDFRMLWKTADKGPNGIDNVYIQVNAEDIKGMYLAQMSALVAIWTEGEAKKKQLKKEARDILLRE